MFEVPGDGIHLSWCQVARFSPGKTIGYHREWTDRGLFYVMGGQVRESSHKGITQDLAVPPESRRVLGYFG